MIEKAVRSFERTGLRVDLKNSFFIGDSIVDMETGKAAGLISVLVFSGREKAENCEQWTTQPDLACPDIAAAAQICRELVKRR
jgi:ribonucleotide monophosphatase NagD (HAD superfamily)